LETVKSVDRILSAKKYSLLFFVVKCLQRHDPRRLSFTQSYTDLPKVMRYTIPDFEKMKNEFSRNAETLREEVSYAERLVEELKDSPEERATHDCYLIFVQQFKPFLEEADHKLDTIADNFEKIKTKASKCAELYGLKLSCSPDEILKLLQAFLESVRRHQETLVKQELVAKRKAANEEKKKPSTKDSKKTDSTSPKVRSKSPMKETTTPRKPDRPAATLMETMLSHLKEKRDRDGEVLSTNLATSDLSKSQHGHAVYQPPAFVRPTAYGTALPILKLQPPSNTGARPQPNNRKRVAVNDQYKKKDEKAEKVAEFSASKLSRTTKFQRETVNLSSVGLTQWSRACRRSSTASRSMLSAIDARPTTTQTRSSKAS
jgi:hypothetical protein